MGQTSDVAELFPLFIILYQSFVLISPKKLGEKNKVSTCWGFEAGKQKECASRNEV